MLASEPLPLATVMSSPLAKEATASENLSVTVAVSPVMSAVSERVKELTEGAVGSTVNNVIESVLLTFPAESVTIIVQFE
jgi:hypothetical protein